MKYELCDDNYEIVDTRDLRIKELEEKIATLTQRVRLLEERVFGYAEEDV